MRQCSKLIRLSLLAIAGALLFASSCKKEKQGQITACTSTVYGYSVVDTDYTYSLKACTYGILNTTTAALGTIGSFSSGWYSNQGTFNHNDNCYYIFRVLGGVDYSNDLYKIDLSGTLTTYTASTTTGYRAPLYNRFNNKMYCITQTGYLAELTLSGSTFNTTNLVMPVHGFGGTVTSTVNNTTGDIFYPTVDSPRYYIERYSPGATASAVVATGSGAWSVCGLRFNKNDNMLYAVTDDYPVSGSHFIKINPTSAAISSTYMAYRVNVDYFSACIDPCSNRYILSSQGTTTGSGPTGRKVIYQYNMSGTLVRHDSTVNFIMGLDADY